MRVLMLNTFDEAGGAARAASRLQQGVRTLGLDADLLVQFKTGSSTDAFCRAGSLRTMARRLKAYLGMLPVRLYPKKPENNFSPALFPDPLPREVADFQPDLIHLHWLGAGFLRVETLGRLGKPLLWTLHDSWAFTGGCHVPFACTRYRRDCGACPVLGSSRERDLSRWTWNRKEKAWRGLNLTVVAPSRWMAECARSSSLFRGVRVEVIPNGLDTEIFRPRNKAASRKLLGLPEDRKIILFGAVRGGSDLNKGFDLLVPALQKAGKEFLNGLALVFSSFDRPQIPDLGMPARFLGAISDDDRLAAVYSAADLFVAPSIQESFCQTAAEAMACGTPVVAFGATGLLDVVEHQRSGYLARPYEVDDLARGIAWVLGDADRHAALARRSRLKVEEEFALNKVSRRYAALYREILTAGKDE